MSEDHPPPPPPPPPPSFPKLPSLPLSFKSELHAKAHSISQKHLQTSLTSPKPPPAPLPPTSTPESFTTALQAASKVLILIGAGLSAPSGIPTYRSLGGVWTRFSDAQVASQKGFDENPGLVWRFHEERRRMCLSAEPNRGHEVLARLARKMEGVLVVNQNIDGLCERAKFPPSRTINLHGSLFDLRCSSATCTYTTSNTDPSSEPLLPSSPNKTFLDHPDLAPDTPIEDLPTCPLCKSFLRPSIVWFGEEIPWSKIQRVDKWLVTRSAPPNSTSTTSSNAPLTTPSTTVTPTKPTSNSISILLVVGTSATVHPAAGYIARARQQGARVAFFNTEISETGFARPQEGDWVFGGSAAEMLPRALAEFLNEEGGEEDKKDE